jgi:hypothetical protein
VKPFATLGSEIGKVRDRVRASSQSLQVALADSLSPRVAHLGRDVREQRDRLLAKLGEQTFRLIAERKLAVPKVLQESVERLANLLGVSLPPAPVAESASASVAPETPVATTESTVPEPKAPVRRAPKRSARTTSKVEKPAKAKATKPGKRAKK